VLQLLLTPSCVPRRRRCGVQVIGDPARGTGIVTGPSPAWLAAGASGLSIDPHVLVRFGTGEPVELPESSLNLVCVRAFVFFCMPQIVQLGCTPGAFGGG
jgi:hypothetical protein